MATTEEQVAACWRLMHDTLAFLPHFDAISALWTHLLAFPERLELMTTGKGPDGEEYDELGEARWIVEMMLCRGEDSVVGEARAAMLYGLIANEAKHGPSHVSRFDLIDAVMKAGDE